MGIILGVFGEILAIIIGLYCLLYFGGFISPKAEDDSKLEQFNKLKNKHGKKIMALGLVLILYGIINIIRFFA